MCIYVPGGEVEARQMKRWLGGLREDKEEKGVSKGFREGRVAKIVSSIVT